MVAADSARLPGLLLPRLEVLRPVIQAIDLLIARHVQNLLAGLAPCRHLMLHGRELLDLAIGHEYGVGAGLNLPLLQPSFV